MVLVLEDIDFIRIELVKKLKNLGLTVISSPNSGDAYRKIMAHKNELKVIILDIAVPSSGGHNFTDSLDMYSRVPKEIRKKHYTIVLSGNINSKEIIKKGVEIDVNDFIKKPYKYSRVLESVKSAV